MIFEAGEFSVPITNLCQREAVATLRSKKSRLKRSFFCDGRKGGSSVILRGATVTDLVHLAWAHSEGELDLSFIKCRGLVSEAGFFVHRPEDTARPPNKLKQPDAVQKTVAANQQFGGARIDGPVTLSGGEFGLIHLDGIFVSGAMMLIAGRSGQISIEDSICDDGNNNNERFIATSQIDNFIMARWHCSDFLYLHAVKITGESNPSRVRGVVIKSSMIDRGVSFWPGSRLQKDLQGYLELGNDRKTQTKFFAIRPDESLIDVAVDQDYRNLLNRWRRQLVIRGNILIDHCSIGDDVLLTGVDLAESEPADGRIEIVDSKIAGNVVFRTPISFLADAQVDEPLLRLLAQRLVVDNRINSAQQSQLKAVSLSEHQARRKESLFIPAISHALDTSGLQADKIDLTGLCVRKPPDQGGSNPAKAAARPSSQNSSNSAGAVPDRSPDWRINTSGNAIMGHLKVAGKVATFARLSKKDAETVFKAIQNSTLDRTEEKTEGSDTDPAGQIIRERRLLSMCFGPQAASIRDPDKRLEANAIIPGSLDFQHSEIGELFISDASFSEHSPEKRAAESGIVLDYAQVSKLYVARSELHNPKSREHNGFPVPVSLLDLSVKTWFLEEDAAPAASEHNYNLVETTTAGPYLDLLENDPEFRMSSYLAIEKSLRDRGLTNEAIQIFIAGNYRDVRTESVKNWSATEKAGDGWRTKLAARSAKLRSKLKPWRRGDGRYRRSIAEVMRTRRTTRDYLELLLFAVWCVAAVAAVAAILVWPSWPSFAFVFVVLFFIFVLSGSVFRLRRPWFEYFEFVVSLIWCGAAVYAGYIVEKFTVEKFLIQPPVNAGYLALGWVLIMLILWFVLRDALRLFLDQLYWSLVDYGTSAWRLAGVIFIFMAVSFALVSGERRNFEPTLLAQSIPQQKEWDKNNIPTPDYWVVGERLWMTLRFHVPLVGAIISEEWQPADRPLSITGLSEPGDQSKPPTWWPSEWVRRWPRARDWYGIMLWMNWVLWPLFLPFLIHRVSRER